MESQPKRTCVKDSSKKYKEVNKDEFYMEGINCFKVDHFQKIKDDTFARMKILKTKS